MAANNLDPSFIGKNIVLYRWMNSIGDRSTLIEWLESNKTQSDLERLFPNEDYNKFNGILNFRMTNMKVGAFNDSNHHDLPEPEKKTNDEIEGVSQIRNTLTFEHDLTDYEVPAILQEILLKSIQNYTSISEYLLDKYFDAEHIDIIMEGLKSYYYNVDSNIDILRFINKAISYKIVVQWLTEGILTLIIRGAII